MASGGINTDLFSDETFDLLCTMCKNQDKIKEAEKFCVDCHDYFCSTCISVHSQVPVLMGHKILDKRQFQQGSSQILPIAPTERCNRHSHKHIDMYCQNHDDVGCSTCMAVDHRLCNDIFYIPDFIKNDTSTVVHKDIQLKLEAVGKTLTEQNDSFHREKQRLLKRKSDLLDNIRRFRKTINDRLDELEKNSVDEIEDAFKSLVNTIDDGMLKLQTHRVRVSSVKNRLASCNTNVSDVFVNVKMGENVANNATKCIEDNSMNIQKRDIGFTADGKMLVQLEDLNVLGSVRERSAKTDEYENETEDKLRSLVGEIDSGAEHLYADNASVSSANEQLASTSTNVSEVFVNVDVGENNSSQAAKCIADTNIQGGYFTERKRTDSFDRVNLLGKVREKRAKYKIKTKSDRKTCDVVSTCILEDGTIILSDCSNMKIKHLHGPSYTSINYCDLPTPPWQVCSINEQQIAVTLPAKQEVWFISLGSKMTTINKITTDFKSYGLAYKNGNLYISDNASSVFIYTVLGRKLKQFSKEKSGQTEFPCIRSLAVNEDASKIYITDFNNGLIILNHNGQVVGEFSGPGLKGAFGCCLTETGSVLLSGQSSMNVLEFGPSGNLIGEVQGLGNRMYPQAISCNQPITKMILSGKHKDYIEECWLSREKYFGIHLSIVNKI